MNENGKENVESFTLDHTKVKAPFIRKCSVYNGKKGDTVTKFDLPPLCKGRCLVNTRRRDCIQFVRQSPIGGKVPALPFVCCGLIGLMVKCGQSGTPVPTIVTYYLCRGGICSTNTIQVY